MPAPEPRSPIYSPAIDDVTTPGVVVEVDPDQADELGAFRDDALSEAEAWESNADVEGDRGE